MLPDMYFEFTFRMTFRYKGYPRSEKQIAKAFLEFKSNCADRSFVKEASKAKEKNRSRGPCELRLISRRKMLSGLRKKDYLSGLSTIYTLKQTFTSKRLHLVVEFLTHRGLVFTGFKGVQPLPPDLKNPKKLTHENAIKLEFSEKWGKRFSILQRWKHF